MSPEGKSLNTRQRRRRRYRLRRERAVATQIALNGFKPSVSVPAAVRKCSNKKAQQATSSSRIRILARPSRRRGLDPTGDGPALFSGLDYLKTRLKDPELKVGDDSTYDHSLLHVLATLVPVYHTCAKGGHVTLKGVLRWSIEQALVLGPKALRPSSTPTNLLPRRALLRLADMVPAEFFTQHDENVTNQVILGVTKFFWCYLNNDVRIAYFVPIKPSSSNNVQLPAIKYSAGRRSQEEDREQPSGEKDGPHTPLKKIGADKRGALPAQPPGTGIRIQPDGQTDNPVPRKQEPVAATQTIPGADTDQATPPKKGKTKKLKAVSPSKALIPKATSKSCKPAAESKSDGSAEAPISIDSSPSPQSSPAKRKGSSLFFDDGNGDDQSSSDESSPFSEPAAQPSLVQGPTSAQKHIKHSEASRETTLRADFSRSSENGASEASHSRGSTRADKKRKRQIEQQEQTSSRKKPAIVIPKQPVISIRQVHHEKGARSLAAPQSAAKKPSTTRDVRTEAKASPEPGPIDLPTIEKPQPREKILNKAGKMQQKPIQRADVLEGLLSKEREKTSLYVQLFEGLGIEEPALSEMVERLRRGSAAQNVYKTVKASYDKKNG